MFQLFGPIAPPPGHTPLIVPGGPGGLVLFLSRIIQLIFVVAGLWVLFNLILGGFQFITAGGDPGKISQAWAKIWQSFLGIIIVASSLLITSIISWIVFGDPGFILNIRITTTP